MNIYCNGQILPAEKPSILSNDRGFLLGDGLFETLRCEQGRFLFLAQHYQRLFASCQTLAIPFSLSLDDLQEACQVLLQANALLDCLASLRITVTRGAALRGLAISQDLKPTVLITAHRYDPMIAQAEHRLYLSDIRRNEGSPCTRLKTLQYLDFILALKQAQDQGFDDAILMNNKACLTETCTANLFFVMDKQIVTPNIEEGVLPGIVRQEIIKACDSHHLKIVQRSMAVSEYQQALEVFKTNSLIEIQSVSKINQTEFKTGEQARWTQKIRQIYEAHKAMKG